MLDNDNVLLTSESISVYMDIWH